MINSFGAPNVACLRFIKRLILILIFFFFFFLRGGGGGGGRVFTLDYHRDNTSRAVESVT